MREKAPFNTIHLFTQQSQGSTAIFLSATHFPGRSVAMTCSEFYIFRLLMFHLSESGGVRFFKKIMPVNDLLLHIFSFLYFNTDIVLIISPESFSHYYQLGHVSSALCDTASVSNDGRDYSTSGWCYFNFCKDIKFVALTTAAHEANLDGLKYIIEKTFPKNRSSLLFTPADANYLETETHIDTAFKIALARGDEEMAEEIAKYLGPIEVARQSRNAFGGDFKAFLKQQKKDASNLFEGLEAAFKNATKINAANAYHYVPDTACALQQKIAEFKSNLKDYIDKTYPFHNDYILEKAYEIYNRNWGPWNLTHFWNPSFVEFCRPRAIAFRGYCGYWEDVHIDLFLRQVIGPAQESTLETSKRRAFDIARGIACCASFIDHHLPAKRSFFLQGSRTDIRTHVGLEAHWPVALWGINSETPTADRSWTAFSKIVSNKNSRIEKLIAPAKSPQSFPDCPVM